MENEIKTSRQMQAEQTKNKLLEVSLKLVRKEGYDQVKITDICDEAGVSVGAFYHHFKNKEGIVVVAYQKCDDFFRDSIYPMFKDREDIEVIYDYLDYQMNYGMVYGIDFATQIYKAQLTDGNEFFLNMDRGLPKGLTKLIEHLQEIGVLKNECKALSISKEILILSRGILYNWCQSNGNYDPRKLCRRMVSNYIQCYINEDGQ